MFDIEKNKLYFIVSLFIGVFFVNFHIQQSLHFGVLSLPPTYDDVGYFGDAFKRLRQIYDYGFLGFFKNYIIAPPHSPIYSLLAMIGFSILGYAAWAACASVLIIIVPLIYLYLKNSFNLSLYNKILLIFSILCAPIFSILCIEFRPDAFCGLATASGIFCILFSTNWNNARKSTIFVAGLLFGVSLITKLTVAPVTIMLFFSAMIIVLFIERNCYRQVLHVLSPFLFMFWPGLVYMSI